MKKIECLEEKKRSLNRNIRIELREMDGMTKKVLFVQPFVLEREQGLTNVLLVWAVYLENYLRSKIKNIKTDLLYLPGEKDNGRVGISSFTERESFFSQMSALVSTLEFELDENTYICISMSTSHHYLPSKLIAEFFKEWSPKSLIIIGGTHASICPDCFNYEGSPIDYLVMGDGEQILYEIIRDSYPKRDIPKKILGKPILKLNDLPPLNLSLLNKYVQFFNLLSISLSRGCPFNCRFCIEQNVSGNALASKRWRAYTPKRALREINTLIDYALNHNLNTIGLNDSIFGVNKKWLLDFLNLYTPPDDIIATWVETRLDVVETKMIEEFKKKRLFLWYGLESFSPRMLSIMDKSINPNKFLEKFKTLFHRHEELGYNFIANVLFNHPGETKDTYNESWEGLREVFEEDTNDVALFSIRYYHHFPGTRLYNNIDLYKKKYGCKDYFPVWWEDEKLLRNASYCIKPSFELSLRESIDYYTDINNKLSAINIGVLKEYRPENFLQKMFTIKEGININNLLRDRILTFLDEYEIELKG